MAIAVEIADRMYDYTDEEQAAEAVDEFQSQFELQDNEIVELWLDESNPKRTILEQRIFDAVDANGSVKRAQEKIPCGITLYIEDANQNIGN